VPARGEQPGDPAPDSSPPASISYDIPSTGCGEEPAHSAAVADLEAHRAGNRPDDSRRGPDDGDPDPPGPPRFGGLVAEIPGMGRLSTSVTERLLCDAEITGLLMSQDNQVLWLGRSHRTAPPALVRALIARDGGCTQCGASVSNCEVHHLLEWTDGGTTDPDNCCLLCTRCHHDHHDRGLTLTYTNPNAQPGVVSQSAKDPPTRQPGRRRRQAG